MQSGDERGMRHGRIRLEGGRAAPGRGRAAFDTGANSYIVKPVSSEGFLDVVSRINDYWMALNVPPPVGAG